MKGLNCLAQITRHCCTFLPPAITMCKEFIILSAALPLRMCRRPHAHYKVF
ncbi:hypothetical protein Pint_22147 [Pistacia integerrima]|uniref:Uncharacterized protein n=1 Tax=Pistacia integerrima TaxID=434235 RepID=A0ACC0YIS5_9ROSI|nr:hypothetical protein Pint_22147 [Pistacia integerrima]